MTLQELLTALMVATVIAPVWKFFLQRRPLPTQQRLVIQTASKDLPQANCLLLRGYATRHQYRQVLIAMARAHRHSCDLPLEDMPHFAMPPIEGL